MLKLNSHPHGVILPVIVHAGARRVGICGVRDGRLKVEVRQPPEKGRANKAVLELLAEQWDLPKSAIVLLSGATSPRKRCLLSGLSVAEAAERWSRFPAAD